MPAAPDWLADPALADVWDRIHARLERTGGVAQGSTELAVDGRAERHALADLLGRSVVSDRVRIDLAALENRVVERTPFGSLAEAAERVTARPLRNRPQERAASIARRRGPLSLARQLVEADWADAWIEGLARSGLLTRFADGERLVRAAAQVLEAVLAPAGSGSQELVRSRVELSAQVLGDAHALDEDTVVHLLVLRALAAAEGVEVPDSLSARRALWERFRVTTDLLSATCLCVGLRPMGSGPLAARLRLAADHGAPVHMTAWDLRHGGPARWTSEPVLVCENPRVLEAFAERFAGDVPVVCTAGQPNGVVLQLLSLVAESGCVLRYHGDFDWPGVAIANRVVGQCGAAPWRMGVADYEAGLRHGGPPLAGSPVEPCWDAELGAAMRLHGRTVHEESVLDSLLAAARHW